MPIDFSVYDAVLLDLDGTIYHEEHILPGAAELVKHLNAVGRRFACLSNSTASPLRIASRLDRMGIEMIPDNIYTAAAAAADYVLERFGGSGDNSNPTKLPRVYNLASEGIEEMLQGLVEWVTGGAEPCDAVIAGTLTNVYATEQRQRVALSLLRHGATLVGICADRVYPSPRGIEFGAGALSALLAYAANVIPVFTGKPQRIFFERLCSHLAVEPNRCLLIGDNLESDIAGAKPLGIATILTLTGVTRRRDLLKVPPELQPDQVIEELTQLL